MDRFEWQDYTCENAAQDEKDKERRSKAADDTQILFRYVGEALPPVSQLPIRWLAPDERHVFNAHLRLCGQHKMSVKDWNGMMKEDIRYCGVFVDGKMVARACIEKLTDRYWEVSDVRTAKEYRGRGYATAICVFVVEEIIRSGRIPTVRTERTNTPMLKVIEKLGFRPFDENKEKKPGNGSLS